MFRVQGFFCIFVFCFFVLVVRFCMDTSRFGWISWDWSKGDDEVWIYIWVLVWWSLGCSDDDGVVIWIGDCGEWSWITCTIVSLVGRFMQQSVFRRGNKFEKFDFWLVLLWKKKEKSFGTTSPYLGTWIEEVGPVTH